MRVALVTTSDVAVLVDDIDRPVLDAALVRRGVIADWVPWDDRGADWEAYDLIVVRSPWDYTERLDAFLAWLDLVAALPTLHNPAALIRWNLDKRYLEDLARRGAAVVPTSFADDEVSLDRALAASLADEVVVKPTVSAGSRSTGRFATGSPGAWALGRDILSRGLSVMVQPFVRSVDAAGERSAVVFDGSISHALRKAPTLAPGGGLRGDADIEQVASVELSAAERDVVDQVLAASSSLAVERGWLRPSQDLLYGRFDVVSMTDGSVALLEAELFEPCFFLPVAPHAAGRFVDAVVQRVLSARGRPTVGGHERPAR